MNLQWWMNDASKINDNYLNGNLSENKSCKYIQLILSQPIYWIWSNFHQHYINTKREYKKNKITQQLISQINASTPRVLFCLPLIKQKF